MILAKPCIDAQIRTAIIFMEFTGICCEDECNDGEYLAAPEQNDNERWAKEQK